MDAWVDHLIVENRRLDDELTATIEAFARVAIELERVTVAWLHLKAALDVIAGSTHPTRRTTDADT